VNRASVLGVAALVLVTAVGWQVARSYVTAEPLPVLYTLGGDFSLTSTLGREAGLSEFRGNVVLLNFGFTHCPDVCPAALSRMRDVIAAFGDDGKSIQPVFVTLDPARDTVEQLRPYLAFFGDSFVGMTGSDEQIAAAAEPFKVFYEKEAIVSELNYSVAHSSQIYLLDVDGQVRATFGQSVTVPVMIETVERLLEETS
jgi:protein SCO1/2